MVVVVVVGGRCFIEALARAAANISAALFVEPDPMVAAAVDMEDLGRFNVGRFRVVLLLLPPM